MRSFRPVIVLCLTYLGIFFFFLPWLCRRWPYSKFFLSKLDDPEFVRQVFDENNKRISIAQDFLRSYIKLKRMSSLSSSEEPVDLVVVVITVNRGSEGVHELRYLTQTVSSVLSVFQNDRSELFRNKIVLMCNVDAKESQYPEAVYLSKVVKVVTRYPESTTGSKALSIFEKEKSDYVFCMREAYNYNPRYILMMEDDALLNPNSLMTLNHLLKSRLDARENSPAIPWIFAKLYYPERWQGYGYEADKVGELIGIALLGGTFLAFLASKISNRRGASKWRLTAALFVVGAATSIAIVVLIGRQYVRSWRSFSPYTHRLVRAPGCCTPAILYPASVVEGLTNYLSEVVCRDNFSVDLAIDAFADEYELSRYLVEPNLCRHIGYVSTIRRNSKKAAEFLE